MPSTRGLDGAEEFELEERIRGQIDTNYDDNDRDYTGGHEQDMGEPLDHPPRYQPTTRTHQRVNSIALLINTRNQYPNARDLVHSKPVVNALVAMLVALGILFLGTGTYYVVTHLVDENWLCGLFGFCSQTPAASVYQSTFRQPGISNFPIAFSVVPGLYMLSATATNAAWLSSKQSVLSPVNGKSSTERPQYQLITPTPFISQNDGQVIAPRGNVEMLGGNIGPGVATYKDDESFTRWGLEILYRLRRRALNHLMHIQKGWCMENTCSTSAELIAMCNSTSKARGKIGHRRKSSFETQECRWCWDEQRFPNRSSAQELQIKEHCENVSHKAAISLLTVCSVFTASTLTFVAMLLVRSLYRAPKGDGKVRSCGRRLQGKGKLLSIGKLRSRRRRLARRRKHPSIRSSSHTEEREMEDRIPVIAPANVSRIFLSPGNQNHERGY